MKENESPKAPLFQGVSKPLRMAQYHYVSPFFIRGSHIRALSKLSKWSCIDFNKSDPVKKAIKRCSLVDHSSGNVRPNKVKR